METVSELQKKYGRRLLAVVVLLAFGFIVAGHKDVGKGLVLGAIFSIVNFVMIGQSLPFKIGRSRRRAFFISLFFLVVRYLALSIPLVVAIKLSAFNFPATVVGIFGIQLMILADQVNGFFRKPGIQG